MQRGLSTLTKKLQRIPDSPTYPRSPVILSAAFAQSAGMRSRKTPATLTPSTRAGFELKRLGEPISTAPTKRCGPAGKPGRITLDRSAVYGKTGAAQAFGTPNGAYSCPRFKLPAPDTGFLKMHPPSSRPASTPTKPLFPAVLVVVPSVLLTLNK